MTTRHKRRSGEPPGARAPQAAGGKGGPAGTARDVRLLRGMVPSIVRERRLPLHPSDDALSQFVQGSLPSAAIGAVRLHLERCRRCAEFAGDLQELMAPLTEEDETATAPREIRDLEFVRTVRDIAHYVTRVFGPKRLEVLPELSVVPDFFKKTVLESGLTPQAYLSRVLAVLASILPADTAIQLDAEADASAFIARSTALPRVWLIGEKGFSLEYRGRYQMIDARIFFMLHSLWTTEKSGFCPVSCRLPENVFRNAAQALTLEKLVEINRLFGRRSSVSWKQQGQAVLKKLAGFTQVSAADPPKEAVLHPPSEVEDATSLFSGSDFMEQFQAASGVKVQEVSDLRAILHQREMASQQASRANFLS